MNHSTREQIIALVCQRTFEDIPQRLLTNQTPAQFTGWAGEFADAWEKKNAAWFRRTLSHGRGFNDGSKRAFFELLGKPLPRAIAGIRVEIDCWAGISAERRAALENERAAAQKAKAAAAHFNYLRRSLNQKQWRNRAAGITAGAADTLDRWLAQGYTTLTSFKRGAVPRFQLLNARREGFDLTGQALEYARLKLQPTDK